MTTIYQHPDTGHLATYSPRAGNDDPNPWVEYACTPFAFSAIGRHPKLPFGYLALLLVPPPAIGTILDGLIDVKPDDADDQRKRADAAEADLAAVDQALAELRDQISRQ